MDTSLKWMIVVSRRFFQWTPNGKGRRGRPHQSGKNQMRNFMRSRNMEEVIAEDKHLQRLRMDRRLLAENNDNNNNNNKVDKICYIKIGFGTLTIRTIHTPFMS
jgi:hypothetical protein